MEPTNQGEAGKEVAKLSRVIQIDEGKIEEHLGEVVRSTVEETLNAMLDAESDRLCCAERCERTQAWKDTRAGSYQRQLQTKAGEVTLRMPKLPTLPFETAIIERYGGRESSVEEALGLTRWPCHCVHDRVPARSIRYTALRHWRADLEGTPEVPDLVKIWPHGRGSPRWLVLPALAGPRHRMVVPRSRPLSGKRQLFLDAQGWRAQCAARAIRASPSATTCCFFSSVKILLMLTEAIRPLASVNVPGSILGRFWVISSGHQLTGFLAGSTL